MVLTDPLQWRCVRVNDAMCKLLGRSRESARGRDRDRVRSCGYRFGKRQQSIDALWVWRLRDGLVASVDIFEAARRDPADSRHGASHLAISA